MKLLIIFLNLLALTLATVVTPEEWQQYKTKYGKSYSSATEDYRRRINLLYNKIYINLHNIRANSGIVSYRLAINQFSDMTKLEFFQMLAGKNYAVNIPPPPRTEKPVVHKPSSTELPIYRNWTQDGLGHGISDQGMSCSASWAFAALAAVEAHYGQETGTLPEKLSVQNLIDCAENITNSCNGLQIPEKAYEYIQLKMNINSEKNYPYTGIQSTCKYNENEAVLPIGDYQTVNDDEGLIKMVAWETPVVIGFIPFSFEFMHYSSGIFVPPRNYITFYHKYFVTVIGYGTESNGKKYWIIKNSMGKNWGDYGYMKMIRDPQYKIANHASFANV